MSSIAGWMGTVSKWNIITKRLEQQNMINVIMSETFCVFGTLMTLIDLLSSLYIDVISAINEIDVNFKMHLGPRVKGLRVTPFPHDPSFLDFG